ncbi:MAG: L,D-transpeptidase, partial [Candidatus Geothermincolales bacterium]
MKRLAPRFLLCSLVFLVSMMASVAGTLGPAGAEEASLLPPVDLRRVSGDEVSGRYVVLTWSPVDGADGYLVYRADDPGGPWIEVCGRSQESMLVHPFFVDFQAEPGKACYYRVASVDSLGRTGRLSQAIQVVLEDGAHISSGPKRMICSLSDQRIYFYEGDQLVNVMRCSTGLNNSTPTGNFRILAHYRTHMGIGGAVCDYWMSFTSSHGMHSWPRGSRVNYETGLGAPASHGCIRLHPLEASWPFYWAPNGTPLTITYASLARRIVSGCHVSVGSPTTSREWYFAEGYTGGGFDTYLLISNPGTRDARITVSLFRSDSVVVERQYMVPGGRRFTLPVDAVEGMGDAEFGIRVSASEEVVAERAMYFTMGKRDDGTASIGAAKLSRAWHFAEGYTADGFETYVLLLNPNPGAGRARLDFLVEGGGTRSFEVDMPPRSRRTVKVDDLPGMDGQA